MNLTDFLRKKSELERSQRDRDRAQGRLDAVLQRLQRDYSCASVGEAKKLLAKKTKALAALTSRYNELAVTYEQTYRDRLVG